MSMVYVWDERRDSGIGDGMMLKDGEHRRHPRAMSCHIPLEHCALIGGCA